MNIIRIVPEAKYVIQFSHDVVGEELVHITHSLADWWYGDNPFLIVGPDVKLMKLVDVDAISGYEDVDEEEDDELQ